MNTISNITVSGVFSNTVSDGDSNSISRPRLHIEIVGFSARERTLIASIFKAADIYKEWQPHRNPQPDGILLDVDDDAGRMWCDPELLQSGAPPVIAIGREVPNNFPVAAHLQRPVRYGQLLQVLNSHIPGAYSESIYKEPDAPSAKRIRPADGFSDTFVPGATRKMYKTAGAVLVVNPNPVGWRYVTAKLAESGYQVDHVSTGARALSLLKEHRYNGIILETRLPDTDGFEICKLVKQKRTSERRNITAIVLTTCPKPLDRLRARMAGCDAFLSKPIDRGTLNTLLGIFLPDCRTENSSL